MFERKCNATYMTSLKYTKEFEDLVKAESEKSECMSILHSNSYIHFNKLSCAINIPVILLSTVVGFMQPLNVFQNAQIALGAVSIFVAILKTLDNYFNWTKRSEAHRLMSLNYWKVSKFIRLQLSIEQQCRLKPADILNVIANDMENLKDSEPIIPLHIINTFMAGQRKPGQHVTALPSICTGLQPVVVNRHAFPDFVEPALPIETVNLDPPAAETKPTAAAPAALKPAPPPKTPGSTANSVKKLPFKFIGVHI
jgi:hypothetical protein